MGILVGMFMGISMGIYCNGPQQNIDTLVVYLLKNMTSSVGLTIPNWMESHKIPWFPNHQIHRFFYVYHRVFDSILDLTRVPRPLDHVLRLGSFKRRLANRGLLFPLNLWGAVHYEKWRFNQQQWWFHHGKWWFHHGKWIKLGISPSKWWNPGSCHSEIQGYV